MIVVQFKTPICGKLQVLCLSISSDPLNNDVFLLQLKKGEIMEVYYKRIKHISAC